MRLLPATLALSLGFALALAACNSDPAKPAAGPAIYAAALVNPERFAKDLERDAKRKPDQVSAFFGIAPGMRVLDVVAGGGYSTEYTAWVVGPKGRVTAFNPPAYDGFVKDELAARYAPGRLPNVERMSVAFDAFAPAANSYDAAIMIQNYHDVYFLAEKSGWTKVDGPKLLAAVKAALKPGAVFGIVDHAGAAGSGTAVAQTLHRIEKSALIKDLEAAGFVLDGESSVLANPADDHSKSVFDDAIRGRTDQFVLRFRKPR